MEIDLRAGNFDKTILLMQYPPHQHHNYCVFDGGTPALARVISEFREEAQLWSIAGARGVSYLLALAPNS